MIRSADFYDYCKQKIQLHPEFEWRYGEITNIKSDSENASLRIDGEEISAEYIFSSIVPDNSALKPSEYFLLQHFQGYYIEAERPVFDSRTATLMDFRIEQEMDTAFVYVLPIDSYKALVEYTAFSKKCYKDEEYHSALDKYISDKLGIDRYKILEVEKGAIPMTNKSFPLADGKIYYIGIAGGAAKPSSGYTFQFIQSTCRALIDSIMKNNTFIATRTHGGRFKFYDSVLLQILSQNKIAGRDIFERLFSGNRITDILSFLENRTNLFQELKIISGLQKWAFLKAAMRYLVGKLKLKVKS